MPMTDADRLKERYRAIGAAQGHRFGEGEPGTPPPDFNIGLAASQGIAGEAASGHLAGNGDPQVAGRPTDPAAVTGRSMEEKVASGSGGAPRAVQDSSEHSTELDQSTPRTPTPR